MEKEQKKKELMNIKDLLEINARKNIVNNP